jgi:hypothetical protein
MFTIRSLIVGLLCAGYVPLAMANDPSKPSYPTVPPDYQELHASTMVADAKVDFPAYYVDHTNGYRVTAPDGNEFVVDDIAQPKCAFYATYVNTGDDGYLGLSGGTEVVSNVYVGEVNFENCQ